MADDVSQPWLNDPQVQSTQSGYATTFADQSDLNAYNRAKAGGASEEEALQVGDNGIGSQYLGGIRTPNVYGVAIPEEQLRQQFGDNYDQWRKARAVVNYGGQNVTVPIVDVGPGAEARARGVVTDFSAPLAKALKSQGYDPARVSIVANGGPDYQSDPTGWYAEQQKIRSALPDSGPWSKDPVAGQPQGENKPWLNDPVVKQPESVKPSEPWKENPVASNHPIAKDNGWTLGQTLLNIWDTTKLKLATNAYATATQRAKDPVPDQIVQQQIDAINASPYLSPEQKQANLKAIQDGQAKEKTDAQAEAAIKQKEIAETQERLKKNNTGPIATPIEQVVGGVLPYLTGGLMGPLGPIQAAQQASAETYGETLDSSTKRLKELHPDWDDGKVVTQALKAASEASRGGGATGLALGVVDVPASGGIISRIAQKIGYGAATMEIANSLAEVQKNMAIKKDVDPQQDWLGQLRNIEFHIQNVVTGGAFGGLHGLGGEIGRPSHVPIEDRVPIAEVPDTKESEATKAEEPKPEPKTELPKEVSNKISLLGLDENNKVHRAIAQISLRNDAAGVDKPVMAAVKYKDEIFPGQSHAEASTAFLKKYRGTDYDKDEFHEGFITNSGKFTGRWGGRDQRLGSPDLKEELDKELSEELKKSEEPVSQPPVTGTDPWLSSIANRYVEPRVAAGEIGEVTPGRGTSAQAQLAKGLQMGPEEIAQHVSDLMQNKGNFRDHAAAVRAEEARLSQQSAQLSRIAEANPADQVAQRNAEDAFKYLTDFHNGPVAKLKNQWHAAGEAMQGQVEVDLGSFNGLREQWLRDVGKEPSKDVQAKMRDTARKVREAQAAEQNAMKTLSDEIDKQTARRKLPTPDEVRTRIMERVKDFPCVT